MIMNKEHSPSSSEAEAREPVRESPSQTSLFSTSIWLRALISLEKWGLGFSMHLSLLLMCKLHRICHSLLWWYDYWPQADHTALAPSDRPAKKVVCVGKNCLKYHSDFGEFVIKKHVLPKELNLWMWNSHLVYLVSKKDVAWW